MNNSWQTELARLVDSNLPAMVQLRRRLHRNPEPSGEEEETCRLVMESLQALDFQCQLVAEGRGVLGEAMWPAGEPDTRPTGCIALRADMDALRIHDAKQTEYRSQRPGLMHACGHDAHTAVVLGSLQALKALEQQGKLPWPVHVRGIFQPAEEIAEGARQMIAEGALEGVRAILATHMDPTREIGRIGLREGTLTAMCNTIDIRVQGRGGHGARPHEARDPIRAAAHFLSRLYEQLPTQGDDQQPIAVSFGTFRGGDNANVIPETAQLRGTMRTLAPATRHQVQETIQQLADQTGQLTETHFEVQFDRGCESVLNDSDLIKLLETSASQVEEIEQIEQIALPSMGSEDFSFYGQQVPAAMFRLGSASNPETRFPLHSPNFDITEESLAIGAKILSQAVILWSDPDQAHQPS